MHSKNKITIIVLLPTLILMVALIANARTAQQSKLIYEEHSINGTHVIAKIRGTALIKLYNMPNLDTLDETEEYTKNRKKILSSLATTSPEKQIEVTISPSRILTLDNFWSLVEKHQIAVEELSLDVITDGKWSSMVWIGNDVVNFSGLQETREKLIDIAPKSTEEMGARGEALFDSARSQFSIRYVRAK